MGEGRVRGATWQSKRNELLATGVVAFGVADLQKQMQIEVRLGA
jgi:hypothetical protein